MARNDAQGELLLVDTCGEQGSVALMRGEVPVAEVILPERAASAGLLGAVRAVFAAGGTSLAALAGVGVVSGPGSFTGLRVGLSVCKGLCEAAGLPLAAVSRLEVLGEAAGLQDGFAVLRAGRDQVYVREVRGGVALYERLLSLGPWMHEVGERDVVFAEAALQPLLESAGVNARQVLLVARQAFFPVRRCLAQGGSDLALCDANYVRDEEAIYAKARP